jgi:hypothetical protein
MSHALRNRFICCGSESFEKAGNSIAKLFPEASLMVAESLVGVARLNLTLTFMARPLKPSGQFASPDQH